MRCVAMFQAAVLVAVGLGAARAAANAGTDILPDSEPALLEMAGRLAWPAGTAHLVTDPARAAGWQFRFSELPNDVCSFGFRCADASGANRLIWLMSEIETERWTVLLMPSEGQQLDLIDQEPSYPVVFQIGAQKPLDEWFERLPVVDGERVFGAHRYTARPTAMPPTLTVYLGSGILDVDELDVPLHVDVTADPQDKGWSAPAGGNSLERVQAFIRKHKAGQADVKDPRPWRRVACPAWAKVTWPRELRADVSRFGLPERLRPKRGPIAPTVTGIDFWHANHFLVHNGKTRGYLYGEITSFAVQYTKGLLPAFEVAVAKYTPGLTSDRDKAVALLTKAMPELVSHPEMPPLGPPCPPDRGADDETLLASGMGWCNEQARVFVRLCQVAGIPARLIFLSYEPPHGGHVVAEFFADGGWAMADASWFCVFPAAGGRLMSAADCHGTPAQRRRVGEVYFQRMRALERMSDEALVGRKFAHMTDVSERRAAIDSEVVLMRSKFLQRSAEAIAGELCMFGVMHYPLPDRRMEAAAAAEKR